MAPLTTSSVMVSLSLWVLWNCRPALYSWGLRGDKRPFNSERREVTEREALREGYQSDIHHTNLSLGTGPAKEGPWRWSSAYMWQSACVRLWGWGDTVCVESRVEEGGNRAAQVSRLSLRSGGEPKMSILYIHTFYSTSNYQPSSGCSSYFILVLKYLQEFSCRH